VKPAFPALVFLAAALLTRLPVLTRAVLDWDESLYFLMAQQWRAGHLPYTTIWDNKPIGIYAIFAAFQFLIPGVAAMRVASIICMGLLAAIVFHITEIITAQRQAAWIAGAALVLCSLSNDGLSANTELFMAGFTALAVLAVLEDAPAWVAGLLLGCAFMVKYVSAAEAPFILALLLHRRRSLHAALACLAGAALPLAAVVLLYAATGHLALWWGCSVTANLRRAGAPLTHAALLWALHTQAWRWGPLYLAALALAFTSLKRPFAEKFLPLWLLGGLAGAASAKSFYDHYFLQVLPVLCVCLGVLLARLPRLPFLRAGVALAALSLPLWAAHIALRDASGPDNVARAGADIAAQHPASLFVLDSQPILYALTALPPPTRYVLPSELTGRFMPSVAGVDAPAETARILATTPQFIVRRSPAPTAPATINPRIYALADAALAAHYALWRHYPGIEVYKLK
jgi:hypothetical protein